MLSCSLAFGQSFTASVRGTAKDPSGASIPRASVTITDADRGTSQTTLADEEGRFAITALPPGQYVLTVEAAGFKKFSSGRFTLAVQQQATVEARLEVGELSETVEVSSSAALVNTTIANLGQVIDNETIVSLPNLGRNPMAFTYLTPGVVGSGGRPGDSNTNFVANGSRNSTSDVLLDGVTVVTVEQNSGVTDLKYSPAVDAVQEFKVQTNFFSAEFGQTGGAVVNMVTKSGTNNFDGTAYYFLRNSALNANNWFTNRAAREKPYYRRDQVGGVFGGPLIKNKTFFFVTYEYTESKSPLSSTRTVPTLLQRQGDFSQTRNAAGQVMTIYNPFDTFVNAQGNLERRPFPGNRIPSSMMDPIALKALAYFPLPNTAEHVDHGDQQLVRAGDFPGCQSPDELQGRSELLGAEPPDRPLQLCSVHPDASQPLRGAGRRIPTQQRPHRRERPFHRDRVHQDAEPDRALERALRPDLRRLRTGPAGELRPHRARSPAVHEGSGHLRCLPEVRPRRLQPHRHRGMAQDGPPGGRPPLLGLLHQDDGRTQPQGGRRDRG